MNDEALWEAVRNAVMEETKRCATLCDTVSKLYKYFNGDKGMAQTAEMLALYILTTGGIPDSRLEIEYPVAAPKETPSDSN